MNIFVPRIIRMLSLFLAVAYTFTLNGYATAQTASKHYRDIFSKRLGLFIHWNENMSNYEGQRPESRAAYYASLDVEKIADEIAAMGFEYVILTNYHGRGIMYPSAVLEKWGLGHMVAPRDVIGEMIDALAMRGIDFIMFTHPLLPSMFSAEDRKKLGVEVVDKGVDYTKWNDFTNDLYAEFAERYGDRMLGIGFDSTLGLWKQVSVNESPGILDLPRLRETIVSWAPNLGLYGLVDPTELTEFKMKEVWRAHWHDPWKKLAEDDYDVENWPCYREMTAVVQGLHWAPISGYEQGVARLNGEQMFRYTAFLAGTTVDGGGVAWAASPYADGRWEKEVREAFLRQAELVEPVREALTDVYCSSSYPVKTRVELKNVPNGIVATKSVDDSREYIHVLNPPDGRTLVLPPPADGKTFTDAKLLATGSPVQLRQTADALELTLGERDDWDRLNTVIAMTTNPETIKQERSLGRFCPMICSSTYATAKKWGAPRGYFNRRYINDGRKQAWDDGNDSGWGNKGWSSRPVDDPIEEWVGIDFVTPRTFNRVELQPRNDEGYEGFGLPKQVFIEVSDDGEEWQQVGEKWRFPTAGSAEPVAFEFEPQTKRFVRAKVPERMSYLDRNTGMYFVQFVEMSVY